MGGRPTTASGDADRAAIFAVYRERYADVGSTSACEKLAAEHGHKLSPNALRAALEETGLWEPPPPG